MPRTFARALPAPSFLPAALPAVLPAAPARAPRARLPGTCLAILALVATGLPGSGGGARAAEPAPAPAATTETLDDVGRELAETAARLAELERDIAAGQTLRRELEVSLEAADSRVGERRARVSGLEVDIARFDATLADLEARVTRERADIDARRERLAGTLRDIRHIGASGGLRTLLGHDDPALAGRLGVYADYALIAQRRAIDAQATVLARLEAARERALKDRNWLEHIKRKATRQRDEHAAERLARAERLASVDGELEAKTRSVAELVADRERLQALLDELEALQSSASGYFAAGRGDYGWPVDGRLGARFGELKSVGKIRWSGLFVEAPEGAPVRAVADGEVVYADRLRGFGLLVVVDHGDDFMTLYGGNRDVTRRTGDWVDAGARIATVGESGGQSVSGVYFEIRESARPIDPEPWLVPHREADGTGGSRVAGG